MLEACMTPDLIVEITLQPVRRYGVDARDLLQRHRAAAQGDGRRPRHRRRSRPGDRRRRSATWPASRRFRTSIPSPVGFVTEAVRALTGELGGTPLIGFAGAPYTLASYLIEGGPSKDHAKTKAMMRGAPDVWDALLTKLAVISAGFLRVQVEAGASAVQLFDSWAGGLSPDDYRRSRAAAHAARCSPRSPTWRCPRIHFGVGTGEILSDMATAGVEVMGVDWRVPLDAGGRADPARAGGPGQPRLDRGLRAVGGDRGRKPATSSTRVGPRRATSSTSATGCFPTPIPTCSTRLVELVHSVEADAQRSRRLTACGRCRRGAGQAVRIAARRVRVSQTSRSTRNEARAEREHQPEAVADARRRSRATRPSPA